LLLKFESVDAFVEYLGLKSEVSRRGGVEKFVLSYLV
jgi:hypothetical protein